MVLKRQLKNYGATWSQPVGDLQRKPPNQLLKKCLTSGFIPPEVFTFLDKQGFIQNAMGVPIFYHQRILFDPQVINNLIYNTDIPKRDIPNTAKKKDWWLQDNFQN